MFKKASFFLVSVMIVGSANYSMAGGDSDPERRGDKNFSTKVSQPPVLIPPAKKNPPPPSKVNPLPPVRKEWNPAANKAPVTPAKVRKKTPTLPSNKAEVWLSSFDGDGRVVVANGSGIHFTFDEHGQALLVILPTARISPAASGTETPVTFVVDGVPFVTLQASVNSNTLQIRGIELLRLEKKLRPSQKVRVISAFAMRDTSLKGFTKAMEHLDFVRNQVALKTGGADLQSTTSVSSKTVVQVQVNAPEQPQEASPNKSSLDLNTSEPEATPGNEGTGSEVKVSDNVPVARAAESTARTVTEVQITASNAVLINKRIGELESELTILANVLDEQRREQASATNADAKTMIEETIASITSRIDVLEREFDEKNRRFAIYLTSIRPNDKDLYLTARKASQVFPKVPYFIPGTKEQGEFWVEPKVSQIGELMFNFRMIDPSAEIEMTRTLIEVTLDQLEDMQSALLKVSTNSKLAHENKIRRNYQKRVACFPADQCPQERQNGELGKASTEVIFLVYEDGSTAGRLQVNKGAFQEGVNLSIESAMLLQAYIGHVVKVAKLEYKSGTQTIGDLDEIFK